MSVYNTNINYLTEAIESILMQRNCEIEFVIVNDGSTDLRIKKLLTSYADRDCRIKLICNEKNVGLTKSLNIGLNECTGKYIARMDSDDISHPDRLHKQVSYMERHSDVDILGCNIKQFGDFKIKVAKYKNYVKDMKVFRAKMLFTNVGPIHPSVMIRVSFMKKNSIKYREDVKKAQDYALWVDCLNAGAGFSNLNERLLFYRIHRSQITIADAKEQTECMQKIVEENLKREFELDTKDTKILSTLYSDKFEYNPSEYVDSIQRLIACVNKRKLLENELQERWIHKVAKCMIKSHDISGMAQSYTYRCVLSANMYRWLKNCIK